MLIEKKEQISSRNLTVVTHPAGVRILVNPALFAYLEPFLGQARTVTEVAALLDTKLNAVHYRVKQFVRLGLLEVTHTQKRRGRSINRYRVPGDGFFIPFEHLSNEQHDYFKETSAAYQNRLSARLRQARYSAIPDYQAWGFQLYRTADGDLATDGGPRGAADFDIQAFYAAPDVPPIWAFWGDVKLTKEDAKALQLELIRLSQRCTQAEGDKRFLVRLAIAPDSPNLGLRTSEDED